MNPPSSSIFSSENKTAFHFRAVLQLGAWIVIGLAVFDILINVVFAYPSDPKNTNPSRLQTYFEYGRSPAGQMARVNRPGTASTTPITLGGWYDPIEVEEKGETPQNPIVTFY